MDEPMHIQVGDILYGMFGYSMILYEFCKVVKMSDKSVRLQPIQKKVVSGQRNTPEGYEVEPVDIPDPREKAFTRRFKDGDSYVRLRFAYCMGVYKPGQTFHEDDMD